MTEQLIDIYYADSEVCAEWDAALLASRPQLASTAEAWRTEIGWYWQYIPDRDFGEGPFDTQEEAEEDALDFLRRGGPQGGEAFAMDLMADILQRQLLKKGDLQ